MNIRIDMYGIVDIGKASMIAYRAIRRLSTPSFGDKPLSVDSYVTQWRWYWKDNDGAWLIYGSVSTSKSFFLINILIYFVCFLQICLLIELNLESVL